MAFKDHRATSLIGVLDVGLDDKGHLIRVRRTLSNVSKTITPDQAFGAAIKIFDLQQHSLMELHQVDTHDLYN